MEMSLSLETMLMNDNQSIQGVLFYKTGFVSQSCWPNYLHDICVIMLYGSNVSWRQDTRQKLDVSFLHEICHLSTLPALRLWKLACQFLSSKYMKPTGSLNIDRKFWSWVYCSAISFFIKVTSLPHYSLPPPKKNLQEIFIYL